MEKSKSNFVLKDIDGLDPNLQSSKNEPLMIRLVLQISGMKVERKDKMRTRNAAFPVRESHYLILLSENRKQGLTP